MENPCHSFIAGRLKEIAETELHFESNVVFGMYSGLALLMDVYQLEQNNGYGIVMIPGSGWRRALGYDAPQLKGNVMTKPFMGVLELVAAGFSVFVVNHRASPRFRYPAALEDVQRAVRYVRHHAKTFGIDPGRIGVFGSSSGGHLASLLGVLHGKGNPRHADPVNRESAKVQAVVALFAASDLLNRPMTNPSSSMNMFGFLGAVPPRPDSAEDQQFQTDEVAVLFEASPINHVTPDAAPFLLVHGEVDDKVLVEQSINMASALEKAGVAVEFLPMPGGGHGQSLTQNKDAPDHIQAMIRWYGRHLQSATIPDTNLQ